MALGKKQSLFSAPRRGADVNRDQTSPVAPGRILISGPVRETVDFCQQKSNRDSTPLRGGLFGSDINEASRKQNSTMGSLDFEQISK